MPMVPRYVLDKFEPTLTRQEFKDECDLNIILKKYRDTCGADFLEKFDGFVSGDFGDFSDVVDYRTALHQVNEAKATFDALPAIVRKRFDNDAATFLDFVHDPNNHAELVQMGLAKPRPDVVVPTPPQKAV